VAQRAGLASAARSPVLSGLAYVAPAELAESFEPRGNEDAGEPAPRAATEAPAKIDSVVVQAQLAAALGRLQAVDASSAAARAMLTGDVRAREAAPSTAQPASVQTGGI